MYAPTYAKRHKVKRAGREMVYSRTFWQQLYLRGQCVLRIKEKTKKERKRRQFH